MSNEQGAMDNEGWVAVHSRLRAAEPRLGEATSTSLDQLKGCGAEPHPPLPIAHCPSLPAHCKATPLPLPKTVLEGTLRQYVARRLPALRKRAVPPCRHPGVTLLIYWYPRVGADGSRPMEPCEFALRQSWDVLGFLPTVIVTDCRWPALEAFARETGAILQEEPSLVPGDIWSMTLDCVARLHTRFATRHVLIVQNDGWPLRDELDAFLRYDCVGAPCVTPGWRERVADLLGLTVLNGGFTLRSRRLCRAVALRWRLLWRHLLRPGHPWLSEDIFYTRTLRLFDPWFRLRFRFAPARVARRFSVECLEGALPVPSNANPMGFHGRLTAAAFVGGTPSLTVVSVVRDAAFHARCLRDNPHLAGARFAIYDNTVDNRPIPERYNAFLDALPTDTEWILFAHEDFQPLEDPRPLLARRNPLFPYGLIGTRKVLNTFILPFGQIEDCNRDGSDRGLRRAPPFHGALLGDMVEAFDCCGFFVHADFFRTWGLRFDPVCAWDLYAEDLCFQFQCATGHLARLLPLRACHWSRGDATCARFLATRDYLNEKYCACLFAGGTCTATIGGFPPLRFRLWRRFVRTLMRWRE